MICRVFLDRRRVRIRSAWERGSIADSKPGFRELAGKLTGSRIRALGEKRRRGRQRTQRRLSLSAGVKAGPPGTSRARGRIAGREPLDRGAVAKAIIFRKTERLASQQEWFQGGYRANIVAYTVARLVGL